MRTTLSKPARPAQQGKKPTLELVEKPSGSPDQWWPDLYLKKGRKLAQIQTEQCEALMEAYVDGRGSSKVGSRPIKLHSIDGEEIGYISYNGRVWLKDIEGDVEIPVEGRKTAAQSEAEGWQ